MACVVCNQTNVDQSYRAKGLDESPDAGRVTGRTIRWRLEQILNEPVDDVNTSLICLACYTDLELIENYYLLINRYKRTYKQSVSTRMVLAKTAGTRTIRESQAAPSTSDTTPENVYISAPFDDDEPAPPPATTQYQPQGRLHIQPQNRSQGQSQNHIECRPEVQDQGLAQVQTPVKSQAISQGQPQNQYQGQSEVQFQNHIQYQSQCQPRGHIQNLPQGRTQGQPQNQPQNQTEGQCQGQSHSQSQVPSQSQFQHHGLFQPQGQLQDKPPGQHQGKPASKASHHKCMVCTCENPLETASDATINSYENKTHNKSPSLNDNRLTNLEHPSSKPIDRSMNLRSLNDENNPLNLKLQSSDISPTTLKHRSLNPDNSQLNLKNPSPDPDNRSDILDYQSLNTFSPMDLKCPNNTNSPLNLKHPSSSLNTDLTDLNTPSSNGNNGQLNLKYPSSNPNTGPTDWSKHPIPNPNNYPMNGKTPTSNQNHNQMNRNRPSSNPNDSSMSLKSPKDDNSPLNLLKRPSSFPSNSPTTLKHPSTNKTDIQINVKSVSLNQNDSPMNLTCPSSNQKNTSSNQKNPSNPNNSPMNLLHPSLNPNLVNILNDSTRTDNGPINQDHPSSNQSNSSLNLLHPSSNRNNSPLNLLHPSSEPNNRPINLSHPNTNPNNSPLNLNKPTSNPDNCPLNLHQPTSDPDNQPLNLNKPTSNPDTCPLNLHQTTSDTDNQPLNLNKPTSNPDTCPLNLNQPTSNPDNRPLNLKQPTFNPDNCPLDLNQPTSDPKNNPWNQDQPSSSPNNSPNHSTSNPSRSPMDLLHPPSNPNKSPVNVLNWSSDQSNSPINLKHQPLNPNNSLINVENQAVASTTSPNLGIGLAPAISTDQAEDLSVRTHSALSTSVSIKRKMPPPLINVNSANDLRIYKVDLVQLQCITGLSLSAYSPPKKILCEKEVGNREPFETIIERTDCTSSINDSRDFPLNQPSIQNSKFGNSISSHTTGFNSSLNKDSDSTGCNNAEVQSNESLKGVADGNGTRFTCFDKSFDEADMGVEHQNQESNNSESSQSSQSSSHLSTGGQPSFGHVQGPMSEATSIQDLSSQNVSSNRNPLDNDGSSSQNATSLPRPSDENDCIPIEEQTVTIMADEVNTNQLQKGKRNRQELELMQTSSTPSRGSASRGTAPPVFKCMTCDEKFDSRELLGQHVCIHGFSCTRCSSVFYTESYLRDHMRKEHSEAELLACKSCDPTHPKHSGDRPFKCGTCGKGYSHPFALKVHQRGRTKEKQATSSDSSKSISQSNSMKPYIGTHPHKCSTCANIFTSAQSLKAHQLTHTSEKPFESNTGGMKSPTRSAHDVHMRIHSGEHRSNERTHKGEKKPIKCATCGKEFQYNSRLKKHMLTHTGAKNFYFNEHLQTGELPFCCNFCGKAFPSRDRLVKHRRTHTEEQSYKCNICGKTFFDTSGLKRHKTVTHSDVRPYGCGKCPSTFMKSSQLRGHVRDVHDANAVRETVITGQPLDYTGQQAQLGQA